MAYVSRRCEFGNAVVADEGKGITSVKRVLNVRSLRSTYMT
jgi:hypothetical protein